MAAPNHKDLDISYEYRTTDISSLNVIYEYVVVNAPTKTVSMPYSYTAEASTRCPRFSGRWSDHTQRVCNRLPYWHAGRRNAHESNYAKLINAFGISFEDLFEQMADARRNFYIQTVDQFQLYRAYTSQILDIPDQLPPRRNLLFNSDFAVKGVARYRLPFAWSDLKASSTGTVRIDDIDDAISGGQCVTMRASANQRAYLHQQLQITFPKNTDLVLSAWVNIPVHDDLATIDTLDDTVAALHLSLVYIDGSTIEVRKALPVTTLGGWERVYVTVKTTLPVYTVASMMMLDLPAGDRDHIVLVDAMQLELGTNPTPWNLNAGDTPPWVEEVPVGNTGPILVHILRPQVTITEIISSKSVVFTSKPKTRLLFIDNTKEFGKSALPTSILSTDTQATLPTTVATKKQSLYTNPIDKLSWKILWRIDPDDDAKIQRITQGPTDILQTFSIADPGIDQQVGYDFGVPVDQYTNSAGYYDLEIRDLTILNDRIWLFCKETLNGAVFYVFKILSMDTFPGADYIQSLVDLAIDSSLTSTLETVESSANFSLITHVEGKTDEVIIGNSESTYYKVTFNYDYYVISETRGQVAARHQYTGDLVIT